jgi:hypothetical protein
MTWREIDCLRYCCADMRYAYNLTDVEWALLERFMPARALRGDLAWYL